MFDHASSHPLPVLYSFRRCPYAMRARLALRYAGIRCALREVVLRDKPRAMLEASPKGTVPVLLLAADAAQPQVIDESLDIMLWALGQHDPDGWLATDRQQADALIASCDNDFKFWLDRYKYPDRYPEAVDNDPRAECGRLLQVLEARLERDPWLMGSAMSLADVALFPFIRQFAHTDSDWFRSGVYPQTARWLDVMLTSELFGAIMKKYPAWQPGDEVTVF